MVWTYGSHGAIPGVCGWCGLSYLMNIPTSYVGSCAVGSSHGRRVGVEAKRSISVYCTCILYDLLSPFKLSFTFVSDCFEFRPRSF
jgi:hypothetical protein